jgi:hypothetical protein
LIQTFRVVAFAAILQRRRPAASFRAPGGIPDRRSTAALLRRVDRPAGSAPLARTSAPFCRRRHSGIGCLDRRATRHGERRGVHYSRPFWTLLGVVLARYVCSQFPLNTAGFDREGLGTQIKGERVSRRAGDARQARRF